MSDSHHMKINQENCEVIYNICLKPAILKCTLYYMHYVTTIVSRIYELTQKNKCTFLFTKFTNYVIEDALQEKMIFVGKSLSYFTNLPRHLSLHAKKYTIR